MLYNPRRRALVRRLQYMCTHARYYYTQLIDGMGQARPSATYLSCSAHRPAAYVSGFRAALDLDTYPLSNLIRPRCAERAKRGRGKPVLIMHIGFFACFHTISLERSQNCHILLPARVALKLLVSLISRLVACSARIVADKQTDTQNDYCNPRSACAPRVNNVRH